MSDLPRRTVDLLLEWMTKRAAPHEAAAAARLHMLIGSALEEARSFPPSLDRRCAALIVTKLEEAQHWLLAAMRAAAERSDREREVRP